MNDKGKKQYSGKTLSRRERLKEFYLSIKECAKCELSQTRTNFVFGSGNADSRILFVGEAPGKNEDILGRPFVGQAGRILDELLENAGFLRSEIFIANVLKCRPPLNRDPLASEIDLCKPYLFQQIEIIDPGIICTMGRYSTQLLLEIAAPISSLRGKIYKKNGRVILPINHPAAALYTRSRLQLLQEDFRRLKDIALALSEGRDFPGIAGALICENKTGQLANPVHETQTVDAGKKGAHKSLKEKEGYGQNRESAGSKGESSQLGLF
ncbi:MAG: uracil-DNA glycosylase [Actinobacteria bacterium]|nr:uracil-DNA glycosylase [Actinomycetota bacterium]